MADLAAGFRLGRGSFGIYTMSPIQLGECFTGKALIASNAAFALAWGSRHGGLAGGRIGDEADRASRAADVAWPAQLRPGGVYDGQETAGG